MLLISIFVRKEKEFNKIVNNVHNAVTLAICETDHGWKDMNLWKDARYRLWKKDLAGFCDARRDSVAKFRRISRMEVARVSSFNAFAGSPGQIRLRKMPQRCSISSSTGFSCRKF